MEQDKYALRNVSAFKPEFVVKNLLSSSPQAFNVVFAKAIERAEPAEEVKERVLNLIDFITYSVYIYTTRGLFEVDKLIFTTQVAIQVRFFLSFFFLY